MAKTMTTSPMTEKQIERAIEIFRAQLRKHASELPSDVVQQVFGQSELGQEWFEVLRKRVEMISKIIVCHVRVDRTQGPQQVLDATKRNQYTDKGVVSSMPRGEGEEVDVLFFKPAPEEYTRPGFMSDEDLEKAFDRRGLEPDPYAQAQVNTHDPAFADTHPNGTHWKDPDDKWCFAAFGQWGDGERSVSVGRGGDGWRGGWWFGGVRKAVKA